MSRRLCGAHSPVFEKASIDEFYVDMTGMERFLGLIAGRRTLRSRIAKETGLPMSMGLAGNKMVAKVATGEIKPNGQMEVSRGTEQPFLDPLPVGKIPMVGEKTSQFLSNLGVRQVRTLREIPQEFLQRIMGKPGITLAACPMASTIRRWSLIVNAKASLRNRHLPRIRSTSSVCGRHWQG